MGVVHIMLNIHALGLGRVKSIPKMTIHKDGGEDDSMNGKTRHVSCHRIRDRRSAAEFWHIYSVNDYYKNAARDSSPNSNLFTYQQTSASIWYIFSSSLIRTLEQRLSMIFGSNGRIPTSRKVAVLRH